MKERYNMNNDKNIEAPKGLRKTFENLCNSNGWDDPSEEFFNDFCAFISHFDFEFIGTGPETEIGIQSVKARIKLNDVTKAVSDSNEEEKQGANDTNKNA